MVDEGKIRLMFFQCGNMHVPIRAIDPNSAGAEAVKTPVGWYVVTHPRGNVVIDGGNAPAVAVDAVKHWGMIGELGKPDMSPKDAAAPALEAAGLDPAGIRWIVQTHLHLDHTGALAQIDRFPNAEVLVTRREHTWAHAPTSYAAFAYVPADFDRPDIPWALLEDSEDGYDLFGDNTLRVWYSPGHSPGHMSIEVNLPSGATFLLTGDAAHTLEHFHGRQMPAGTNSLEDAVNSLRRLRRIAWRRDATVIAGHDPEQFAGLRKAPEYYD